MEGKLVIGYNEEFGGDEVFQSIDPYGYEIRFNTKLDKDFNSIINKSSDFNVDTYIEINENDKEAIKFLNDFKKDKNKYIRNAEYVYFDFSVKEIAEYIKNNPILNNKKILFYDNLEKNSNLLDKILDNFDCTSNLYFDINGNTTLIDFNEYRNTIYKLRSIANVVEKFKFSPLEKIMYVYDIVRNKVYSEVDNKEKKYISRNLSSAILGEKIVCVGYAEIFKAILRMLGIDCKTTQLMNKENDSGHMRNEIYIKDDKYDVDGVYYFDLTFDSKRNNNDNSYLYSYKFFGNTYNEIRKYDGSLINQDVKCFDTIKDLEKMLEEKDVADLPEDMIKTINHMSLAINKKILINDPILQEYIPDSYKQDKQVILNEVRNLFKYYNKKLYADTLLKVLYNVRKNQYYNDPEKYPFKINDLYKITILSNWKFKLNDMDIVNLLFSDDDKEKENMHFNKMIEFSRKEELLKKINQIELVTTLRKVYVKKYSDSKKIV